MTQKRLPDAAADTAALRRALSCFATGVAVVTALGRDGEKVGITINSFSSVSLEPPLVLWSIAEDSQNYDTFTQAEEFAVHVLAAHQEELVERFAQRDYDQFDGIRYSEGIGGVPILSDWAACFECTTEHIYPGGDHKIIVGRVRHFDARDADPLVLFRSDFLQHGSQSGN